MGDGLRECPAVAARVFRGVLPFAERVVGRGLQDPRPVRADERCLERGSEFAREEIIALRIPRGETEAQAAKRKDLVARGADEVLGLPRHPPGDARAGGRM